MSYRIEPPRKRKGNSIQTLRYWGLFALAVGIAAQTIIQNRILGVNISTGKEVYDLLADSKNMALATAAIVAQLLNACAIPLFCFLLVEGVVHTKSFRNYFLRVAGIALLSEIPFNLVMTGKVLDLNSRNPVVGLVLAMVVIFFLKQYAAKSFKGIAIPVLVIALSILWVDMLRIEDGAATVLVAATLWLTRKKLTGQVFGGAVVMCLCMIMDPLYMLAPLVFLFIHFYNGEKGESIRWIDLLAYPALLLGLWLLGLLAF
ncbi:MAG: hypothetical protein IJW45_02555 [Oscillospiraceae bacterium]|nr:hypothetical protein [Oscillospiraceae bacterium]